jgi:hypothetical protein
MQLISQKANVVRLSLASTRACEDCKFCFVRNLNQDKDPEGKGREETGYSTLSGVIDVKQQARVHCIGLEESTWNARDRTLFLWNMLPLFIVIRKFKIYENFQSAIMQLQYI